MLRQSRLIFRLRMTYIWCHRLLDYTRKIQLQTKDRSEKQTLMHLRNFCSEKGFRVLTRMGMQSFFMMLLSFLFAPNFLYHKIGKKKPLQVMTLFDSNICCTSFFWQPGKRCASQLIHCHTFSLNCVFFKMGFTRITPKYNFDPSSNIWV